MGCITRYPGLQDTCRMQGMVYEEKGLPSVSSREAATGENIIREEGNLTSIAMREMKRENTFAETFSLPGWATFQLTNTADGPCNEV